MWDNLLHDVARLQSCGRPSPLRVVEAALFDSGLQAVLLYRFARYFKVRRIPIVSHAIARIALFLTGADISPSAEIGPGLKISHGTGLVVGGATRIGKRAHLHQNVTLGATSPKRVIEMPRIGDDFFIGCGACVLGAVDIGNDVYIGANTLVTGHVPDHTKVVCAAAVRIVKREESDYLAGDPATPHEPTA